MKKRFLIWTLCLGLAMPLAFTSCNNGEDNGDDTTQNDNVNVNNNNEGTAPETQDNTANTTEAQTNDNPVIHAMGDNMADMRYDMSEIHLKAGNKIHLTLINDGSDPAMIHNVVIVTDGKVQELAMAGLKAGPDKDYVPADNNDVIAHTKMAKPHETVTVDFTAPAAGTYEFYCSYPGHFTKMRGKVIVE
jgi:azurin